MGMRYFWAEAVVPAYFSHSLFPCLDWWLQWSHLCWHQHLLIEVRTSLVEFISDLVPVFHISQSFDTFRQSLNQAGLPRIGGHWPEAVRALLFFRHETPILSHQVKSKVTVTVFSKQIEAMELLVYLRSGNCLN